MQHIKKFLVVLLFAASALSATSDLIATTCRTTPDAKICETALRSDPRSPAADTEGLIRIMIDAVTSKFTDSLSYVNRRMKESPPEKWKALKECARRFKVVLEANVVVAQSAVSLGDPKFGEGAMLDSAVEASACERAVAGGGGEAALVERARFLRGLSNVAASMIRVLE